jgi:predicted MPP superfamily phosphohydrolase
MSYNNNNSKNTSSRKTSRNKQKHRNRTNNNENINLNIIETYNMDAICLRFRNKGCKATIENHKDILNKTQDHVWWGWWAKDYEKLDSQLIEYIRLGIRNNKIRVYLVNVNESRIYSTECTDISNQVNGDPIDSPEKNHTPDYYSNYKIKVWFKFKKIDELNNEEIEEFYKSYSFCDSIGYLSEHVSRDCFLQNGKRADCIEAFSMQKVSIWFLRIQYDSDELISDEVKKMWNVVKARKTNFPKSYYRSKSNKILILSDLHFGDKHKFNEVNCGEFQSLSVAIENVYENEKYGFCGIIVAGDFTWSAKKEEFDQALCCLKELMEYFNLTYEQVAVVPGNHDIKYWTGNYEEDERYKKVTVASMQSKEEYRQFYKSLYNGINPEDEANCLLRRIRLGSELPIEIICLDSIVLQQDGENFVGQGYVGEEQLDKIRREMELIPNIANYSYRILVIHHHILSSGFQDVIDTKKPYSELIDNGRVRNFIKDYKIDLVIHGHNHANMAVALTLKGNQLVSEHNHTFDIISVGSAGLKNVSNCIGELEFKNNGEIIYTRRKILKMRSDDTETRNGKEEARYHLKRKYYDQNNDNMF